uniref:Uncharacterized protein n=1 Tax=Vespula pensylvanica TaxID=30213 RepID=A0A834U5C1_VESPE|nr:hypothetical protein H0235_011636 [Vespula pensylvanica]
MGNAVSVGLPTIISTAIIETIVTSSALFFSRVLVGVDDNGGDDGDDDDDNNDDDGGSGDDGNDNVTIVCPSWQAFALTLISVLASMAKAGKLNFPILLARIA